MITQKPIPSEQEAQVILQNLSVRMAFMLISLSDDIEYELQGLCDLAEEDPHSLYPSCFGRIDN
jgi:hypothetical protein